MRRLLPMLSLCLAACGLGDRSAGVVSETTNGLAGAVVDGDGKAVAAARVAWRPTAFLPGEGPGTRSDTGTALTDDQGRFDLKGLPDGEYRVEIRGTGAAGGMAALKHALRAGARDTLGAVTLADPGEVVVRLAAGAAGTAGEVLIRAYGTDLRVTAGSGDTVVLAGLPAGEYDLRLTPAGAGQARDVPAVRVASGALTAVGVDPAQGTFQVTLPSAFALDSARVHAFLRESGALKTAAFDSVVRRRGDAITALILSGIKLDSLPASVGALDFLDSLWINACGITALPPALLGLDSLRSLNLSYNSGLAVPAGIQNLSALEHLDLSGLALGTVPAWVAALPALENLALRDNGLDSVPAALVADARLRQLWLSGNNLAALPDLFTAAHALEKLLLDGNRLTTLPPSLRQLGKLQVLHLRQNRLCDIPAETRTFIDAVPGKDDWTTSQTGC